MSDNVIMPKQKSPPKRDARDERVTFRCSSALRVAIEHAAAADQRSVSDWIVLQLQKATTAGGH